VACLSILDGELVGSPPDHEIEYFGHAFARSVSAQCAPRTPHLGLRLDFQRFKDVAADDEEDYDGYDVRCCP
jgi:hypothetical protein